LQTPTPSSVPGLASSTARAESDTPTPSFVPGLSFVSRLPSPASFTWQLVVEGLEHPTGLENAGDGSNRLFILEQAGVIRILQDGQFLPEPFLDLRARVSTSGGTTRGLLGLAFHPDYEKNGIFFIHYTRSGGEIVVSRMQVSLNPDQADPDSEQVLLSVQPPVGEHNGGKLAFGPDGYLYVSLGDGGGPGYYDQSGNAQNVMTLFGSLLRLDVDPDPNGEAGQLYSIPPDNPFSQGGGLPEIWAFGLRNPWRFSFDRLTGDLYLADVGESQWEELNFLPAGSPGGANYGWNYREALHAFTGLAPSYLNLQDPILEYDHTQGCSITGGEVYRGQQLAEWFGVYLYGDYCSGSIWGLLRDPAGQWQNEKMFTLQVYLASFGLDEAGEVYLVDYRGKVFQLVKQ
jgi:glucose/arabinose dehydrogenase